MLFNICVPMATISPNKKVEKGKDAMNFLNWYRMSLTVFSYIKIKTCPIKDTKFKDLLALCQIFLRQTLNFFYSITTSW